MESQDIFAERDKVSRIVKNMIGNVHFNLINWNLERFVCAGFLRGMRRTLREPRCHEWCQLIVTGAE